MLGVSRSAGHVYTEFMATEAVTHCVHDVFKGKRSRRHILEKLHHLKLKEGSMLKQLCFEALCQIGLKYCIVWMICENSEHYL